MSLSQIVVPLLFVLMEPPTTAVYVDLDCFTDTSYTEWGHDFERIAPGNQYWIGSIAVYRSRNEVPTGDILCDYQFKFTWCRPNGDTDAMEQNSRTVLSPTRKFQDWRRGCGGLTQAISGMTSDYVFDFQSNPIDGDRRFIVYFHGFKNRKYRLSDCIWSIFCFSDEGCSNAIYHSGCKGLFRRIESFRISGRRKFRFECCRVQTNDYNYPAMVCDSDGDYVNAWDGYLLTQTNYFLSGMHSVHDNHRGDRRFKWDYCNAREEANAEIAPLGFKNRDWYWSDPEITPYRSEWVRDCNEHSANSAIIRARSEHDNDKEDRQWRFECGEIQPENIDKSYEMKNCAWSGYLNFYEYVNDYECPDKGVIQGLWSKYSSSTEDRIWQMKCCQIVYAQTSALLPPEDVLFSPRDNVLLLVVLVILSVICGGVCGMMERCRRKKVYPSYERISVTGLDDNDCVDAV
eukprot:263422_1